MKSRFTFRRLSTALLLSALLIAIPGAGKDKKQPPPVDVTKIVWPGPPAVARIRYVGTYQGEEIRGIKKQGFLEKLAGVEDATQRNYLRKPSYIAVDSKGRAYVTDSVAGVVFVFDIDNKTLEFIGNKPPANLRKPMGIAIDTQDNVFVSDAEQHTVTIFSATGEVVGVFGEAQLLVPGGVAVDEALERIYVADSKVHKVAQFNYKTYKFERWIGKSGDEVKTDDDKNAFLLNPTNVAIDDSGAVYVVDTFLDHIVIFDFEGNPTGTVGTVGTGAGKFMRPRGIAFDADGHLYVTDAFFDIFQILQVNGQPLLAVGRQGVGPGEFQVPAGIAIDRSNRIFVADQFNARLQVFQYVTDEEAAKLKSATPSGSMKAAVGRKR